MDNVAIQNPDRRRFLRAVPVAAVAGLTIADASFFAASAVAQDTAPAGAMTFQEFSTQEIQNDMKALIASPGNKNLVDGKTFTMVLTTETAKSATEFEWHEHATTSFRLSTDQRSSGSAERRRTATASHRESGKRPSQKVRSASRSIRATCCYPAHDAPQADHRRNRNVLLSRPRERRAPSFCCASSRAGSGSQGTATPA